MPLQTTVPCSQCQANLPRKSRFCSTCGAVQAPSAPVEALTCGNCGAPAARGKFCPSCGTPSTTSSVSTTPQPRRLDMVDVEERIRQERAQREMQEARAAELAASKRAMAERKLAQMERDMRSRPHQVEVVARASGQTSPCYNCRTQVPTTSKLCPSCGSSVATARPKPVQPPPQPVRAMPVQPPPPAPVYSSPAPSLFPASTSQTKQCAACGIAAPNMKFCPSCGAPTKASSPNAAVSSTATASRECAQCRATLAPNAKFCSSCGTSTARSSSRASPGKMASSSLSHMAKAAAARTYAAPTPQTTAAAVAAAPSVLALASKFQANQPPVFQAGSSSALASVSSECSQCRTTLAPKAKFCPSCGTSTAQMPPRTSQAKAAASASISDLTKAASKMTVAPTPQTTTMVVAGAPSALAMASNLHAAAPPAFFSSGSAAPPSRSTGQSTQQRPPFVPPTFVPPEHGTNHVYTMTQTVTRSVTYNA